MAYVSRYGRRPNEMASKGSHINIINDENVKHYLEQCDLPKESDQIEIDDKLLVQIDDLDTNPIKLIIAVDGGYTEVPVKRTFPSSTISFFQFGALLLKLNDLEEMAEEPFISPDAMAKMKDLQRIKLVVPTKNISLKKSKSLTETVRITLYDFFKQEESKGESWLETCKWFLFEMYNRQLTEYQLSNCPICDNSRIMIKRAELKDDYTFKCPRCYSKLFLTDFFRLHEVIDDEIGAGGILGYMTSLVEQFVIIHTIRIILKLKPDMLNHTLFLKDGPLAFFGQTANMHAPMRELVKYLISKHNLYMVGLEKSGAFVEHADEIKSKIKPGQVLLLNNKHIYTYILPGDPETKDPYAHTSYYSSKIIYKAIDERIYVATIPTLDEKVVLNPKKEDFPNLDSILSNVAKLKCDMYDNSLIPVALVNKLVSLSNHPSAVLLEKFAKASI